MRRVWLVGVGVLCLLAAVSSGVGSAQAKVAGSNGQIAFSRFDPALGDSVTFTANSDGSTMSPLLPGFASNSPHWSPDGSEVAVVSGLGEPCCASSTVILNADTHAVERILPPVGYPAVVTSCSIWSPDGSHFACDGENDNDQSVNGVYTIRSTDGGGLTRITHPASGDDLPIDYSPDGSRLVYGHTGPFHTCDTTSALFVVALDGNAPHRITPWGFCDDDGSWSPDGTRIAFVTSGIAVPSQRGFGGSQGAIFTVHPDGSGLTRIPLPRLPDASTGRAFAGDVCWSPDGTRIVFIVGVRTTSGGQEGIATANADGSDVHWVTLSPTFDNQPDWGTHPSV